MILRFLFALIFYVSCTSHVYDKAIIINNTKFFVKLAFDELTRTKGYMGTKNINENNGMLFIFKKEKNLSFWMKDTPVPLEIAYINSAGIIKEIYSLVPFSKRIVNSRYKVKYALEVPEGSFSKFKIKVGDKVNFNFDVNSLNVE
ncbi:DUF192 domain-containing protein [Borrelia hermsii]|uniref:DUF192 domain-containing protein n=3 Tax=Borrelia hermsii TaxID=140 RepID=A0AAN0X507_BORHE|nr:DUF192 domain-containing protein [Borrelia hermsii]AAX17162.1 hypothetical protein BH0663 [Borrelia hermsii DAH]AJW73447.1 hypothetical protein L283_03325 [Borrelia hermsii CC1]AMR75199.1 hypothetical protein A0V01_00985 [Borrelia hermsii]ANA43461.1 hypothetical protein AXX13_03335 [Borrelia hermsii HS1]UCP01663.1 DUF192 domain-containing protein [Borrelia hermsii]